ncbi:hypothetical protein CERSUDRAFT_96566 [Gelatoporia subvermispora B]|uniref:FBD domain-containing protein n=1 Tax=Ceriporiopsis subvermispora (strain B) TaxID=914234 RepID=M2QTQ8_CERS8|nr:hypothetical protein CERSUDRAFT_96566 [Gelatoporia subvermispora B]
MGEAWPLLTKMVLILGLRAYPSTKALAEFLSRCPVLEHLELEGLAVSPAEDVTIAPIFPHHLRFLALRELFGDSEILAHFLDEVFFDPIVCKMQIFFQGDEEELEQLSALNAVVTRMEAPRGAKQASKPV